MGRSDVIQSLRSDLRALALVGCVAACAAVALPPFSAPPGLAATAAGLWVCAGWYALGARSVGMALPALSLASLTWGGWEWWIGWTAAGAAMAMAAGASARRNDARRLQLTDHLDRFPVLLDACQQLSSARDGDAFARSLAIQAHRLCPAAVGVRVYLGVNGGLHLRAGDPGAGAPGADERYVAAEARPLVRRHDAVVTTLLPLQDERRVTGDAAATRGCLAIDLPAHQPFDPLRREAFEALARLGGLGLSAVDLVERTRAAAVHDELTGLFGGDEFRRRLDERVADARRYRQPLSLILLDLDHLKAFNDAHGHATGDLAITAVGRAIAATVPERAIACRMGGEEFAVILPGAARPAAATLAHAIRAAVASAGVDATRPDLRVTASLGVAELGTGGAETLLERADGALYQAKEAGRDRVSEALP
jgi:diguanylate cyclase (GGDEF)-like protein